MESSRHFYHPDGSKTFTQDPLIAAAWHFEAFMKILGFPVESDDHLEGTPRRVARMYRELFAERKFEFTTFPSEGSQMIVVRDIPFVSFCAHHFLPFTGHAHLAYIPDQKIAGLSKLPRTVAKLAARPQVQERLTEQVADYLTEHLEPAGVGVMVVARHECMELRGIRSVGAVTVTSALRGLIKDDEKARAEFLTIARG